MGEKQTKDPFLEKKEEILQQFFIIKSMQHNFIWLISSQKCPWYGGINPPWQAVAQNGALQEC